MPTHVYANNNEIASKASEGKSIAAFPDVCFSPPAPPVGPMPLPYPNTGECTNTDKGTSKVFIKDKMSGMEGDSNFSKSMGDESATQNFNKGMITSAMQGKCYFGLWSMDVQMEGKGVPRHLDMVTHNHASQAGQIPSANQSEKAVNSDENMTRTLEEKISAKFIKGKFDEDINQLVLNNEESFLCGNCGSPVTLRAIGNIGSSESVTFVVKKVDDIEVTEICSENISHVMWQASWVPQPCMKTDVEYCLSVKSSTVCSEDSTIKYKVKALKTKEKMFHQPERQNLKQAKIYFSIENGEITFSLNLFFEFFLGTYCSDAISKFPHSVMFKASYIIRMLESYKIYVKFEEVQKYLENKVKFVISSTSDNVTDLVFAYKHIFESTNTKKSVKDAKKIQNMMEQIRSILVDVENFYNASRVIVWRSHCRHGKNCSCKYPLKFKFNIVDSPSHGNYIETINIFERYRVSNGNNWGLENVFNDVKPREAVAHEIGHLLGFYDEYIQEAVDIGNKKLGVTAWKFDSNALMDGPANIMLRKEYLRVLLQGIKDRANIDFDVDITQDGAYNFKTKQFETPKSKSEFR